MAKDRARDDRRSVGSHEKMVGALARATGSDMGGSDRELRKEHGISVSRGKDIKGNLMKVTDTPGKGHVSLGKVSDGTFFHTFDHKGLSGTAGISGEHKGKRGAPSNIASDLD